MTLLHRIAPLTASITLLVGSPILKGADKGDENEVPTSERIEQNWDDFVKVYVNKSGQVAYTKIKAQRQALDTVRRMVQDVSPDSYPELFETESQKFAYWLNAYNLSAIVGVVDHYPIESVQDVKPFSLASLVEGGGFFAALKFEFGGKKMSLHKLENKLIRERFHDPRLHFALNCASGGCPELPQEAFQAGKLDEQLETETKLFVRDPEKVQIDHKNASMRISSIFDWYKKDFLEWPLSGTGERASSLQDYVAHYLTKEERGKFKGEPADYAIEFIPYDWSLNAQSEPTSQPQ